MFLDGEKFYDFISAGVDSTMLRQICWSEESDLDPLPATFDWDSSIITFDIDFPSSYTNAEIGWITVDYE